MDHHREVLAHLCRICGKRAHQAKDKASPKLCMNYAIRITNTFGIKCENDEKDIHPEHICHSCYCKTNKSRTLSAKVWHAHSRTGRCETCEMFREQAKGGRPLAAKGPGRKPKDPEMYLNELDGGPSSHCHDSTNFASDVSFVCKLCNLLLNEALQTQCGHLFCKSCLKAKFNRDATFKCPTCHSSIKCSTIVSPDGYFDKAYMRQACLCLKCKKGIPLEEQVNHRCQSEVESMLARPLTAALTPSMEALGSHIFRTKLKQSGDGIAVSFKTGGLVSVICNNTDGNNKSIVILYISSSQSSS